MLKTVSVGSRGHLFSFDDPYFHNSYVISGKKQIFVCDTSCGPEPMTLVKKFIAEQTGSERQIIIFNSHHHYDHVWGNCAFSSESIYAHQRCYELLLKYGLKHLQQFASHKRGTVELVLPNQLFANRVLFEDGAIEFIHTPGHSYDSSSCFDSVDRVLFVGDNVESPIPFIFDPDIDQYIATLLDYLSLEWDFLVAGHDPVQRDSTLIKQNLEYLEKFRNWELRLSKLDEKIRARHVANLVEFGRLVDKSEISSEAKECFLEAKDVLPTLGIPDARIRSLREEIDKILSTAR